ncbi:MAG: dephospho-CoA kinase [Flavobacteriales bacterium]|nr:dephospho-CoA kinase [Flavobacteriales bacterium]
MIRVGLTGGIGSGKTTVARIFSALGVPIYYADERAKYLMHHDVDLKVAVSVEFGPRAYVDGELDRAYLSSVVFADRDRLKALNRLVHPAVRRDYRAWLEGLSGDAPYCIKEAAIIFETGGHKELDRTILVTAPEDLRIERVMQRDDVSEEQVRSRMKEQWSDADKLDLADHVIQNDGKHSLIEQVMDLHEILSAGL